MISKLQQESTSFLDQLFDHGLFLRSSVKGVYGRGEKFEEVIRQLENLITVIGRDSGTEVMRFPPLISRQIIEQSGYLHSFPHLLGSVHAFTGDYEQHAQLLQEAETHRDWGHHLSTTPVVVTPAACYPVYPAVSGTLPESGRLVDISSYCFRHEESSDPARMQTFRMREFVSIADPTSVQAWRESWMQRGMNFLQDLGLEPALAPAKDPFFGPGGRLLAKSQQEQELKFELLVPVNSKEQKTAVMSFNYHQDHFGSAFGIYTSDSCTAHSACTAFGLDRIALALFSAHGFDIARWPGGIYRGL